MLKLYNDTDIQDIANAIRDKNGSSDTYLVSEMAQAISNISGGSGYEYYYEELWRTSSDSTTVSTMTINLSAFDLDKYDLLLLNYRYTTSLAKYGMILIPNNFFVRDPLSNGGGITIPQGDIYSLIANTTSGSTEYIYTRSVNVNWSQKKIDIGNGFRYGTSGGSAAYCIPSNLYGIYK